MSRYARKIGNTPASWEDPSIAYDGSLASSIVIQVTGSISVSYTPQVSIDGTTFFDATAVDQNLNTTTAIASPGVYYVSGPALIKLTGGTGGTFTIAATP